MANICLTQLKVDNISPWKIYIKSDRLCEARNLPQRQ